MNRFFYLLFFVILFCLGSLSKEVIIKSCKELDDIPNNSRDYFKLENNIGERFKENFSSIEKRNNLLD